MYLSGNPEEVDDVYFPLVRDFLQAAPSALPIIDEINNLVLGGELYKGLRAAKTLVAYERDLIAHATRSSERLRTGGADGAVAA